MIVVRRYNSKNLSEVGDSFLYEIAGMQVLSSEKIGSLTAFSLMLDRSRFLEGSDSIEDVFLCEKKRRLQYQGFAQFNQKMRKVEYWRSEKMTQIDVDGTPVCIVDLSTQTIVILNDDAFDTPLNLEVITGPALIVLLAQQSIYCLHAGAVAIEASPSLRFNVAFLGDSGAGKSTLSRHHGDNWRQISDDILPVLKPEKPVFYENFPQLKLPNSSPLVFQEGSLPLDCIVVLNQESVDEINIQQLMKPQALLSIIRHTVAVRLFDDEQTKKHLYFVKQLVDSLSVLSLSYPRELEQLPYLRGRINEYLSNNLLVK